MENKEYEMLMKKYKNAIKKVKTIPAKWFKTDERDLVFYYEDGEIIANFTTEYSSDVIVKNNSRYGGKFNKTEVIRSLEEEMELW